MNEREKTAVGLYSDATKNHRVVFFAIVILISYVMFGPSDLFNPRNEFAVLWEITDDIEDLYRAYKFYDRLFINICNRYEIDNYEIGISYGDKEYRLFSCSSLSQSRLLYDFSPSYIFDDVDPALVFDDWNLVYFNPEIGNEDEEKLKNAILGMVIPAERNISSVENSAIYQKTLSRYLRNRNMHISESYKDIESGTIEYRDSQPERLDAFPVYFQHFSFDQLSDYYEYLLYEVNSYNDLGSGIRPPVPGFEFQNYQAEQPVLILYIVLLLLMLYYHITAMRAIAFFEDAEVQTSILQSRAWIIGLMHARGCYLPMLIYCLFLGLNLGMTGRVIIYLVQYTATTEYRELMWLLVGSGLFLCCFDAAFWIWVKKKLNVDLSF